MNRRAIATVLLGCAGFLMLGCSQERSGHAAASNNPQTAGYVEPSPVSTPQEGKTAVMYVSGLSCPLCVQAIRKEVGAVPGVENIDINYQDEYATLTLNSRKPPTRDQLTKAVEKSGYQLTRLHMN